LWRARTSRFRLALGCRCTPIVAAFPAVAGMPQDCSVCGKGLTRQERRNPDRRCHKHTTLRTNRCPSALMREYPHLKSWPRSGGMPEALSMKLLPRNLREEFPSLTSTFTKHHEYGGGVWCLSARPDVKAVRDLSRFCYRLRQRKLLTETDALCFALTGNRLWDPCACLELKSVVEKCPSFTLQNVRSLLKRIAKGVQDGHAKLGCPTGCAGAHSGLTWLRYVCASSADFSTFKAYVAGIVPQLRNAKGGVAKTEVLWRRIAKPKPTIKKPKHLGIYYKMQTFRICRHAYYTSSPRRSAQKHCPDSKYLWDEVLLKYGGGGARKKSVRHGLQSWKKAKRFCDLIRAIKPNFCMCDLSCWICLS